MSSQRKKRVGRPKKVPTPGERVSLGLRVTAEIKMRLDQAAESAGRSQSQEAELRLERSFETEDRLGGPRLVEMIETIASVMKLAGQQAVYWETGKLMNQGEWLVLPYPFDQAVEAAKTILEHYRPPGEITVPKPNVVKIIGVRRTKVEGKESLARFHRVLAELGPLTATSELRKKEQDNE